MGRKKKEAPRIKPAGLEKLLTGLTGPTAARIQPDDDFVVY